MRYGQAALLAALAGILGVTACGGGGGSGSSADIVFTSHRDRYYLLYTMKADGSDHKRLDGTGSKQLTTTDVSSDHPYGSVQPSWSHDGNSIVFIRFDTVWTRDTNGHEQQLTRTAGDFNPAWRPGAKTES